MTVSEIHVTEGGGQGEALLDVRDLKTHFLTRAGVAGPWTELVFP